MILTLGNPAVPFWLPAISSLVFVDCSLHLLEATQPEETTIRYWVLQYKSNVEQTVCIGHTARMKRFKRFGEACPPRIVEALCRAKGRTPVKRLLITFAVICLFGEFASGQTTGANTGPTSFGASDEHEYDSINLATLVPTFHFPVVSKTGAISFGLSIESPQICHIDSVPSWTCGNNGHFADFTPTLTTALWDTTAIYFQTVS